MTLLPVAVGRVPAAAHRGDTVGARPALAAPMLRALVVAATAELGLLRLFTRTAIHIPAFEQVAGPYRIVSGVARYSFYAAAVLLVANLGVFLWTLVPSRTRHDRAVVLALAGFLAAAAAGRLGLVDDVTLAVLVTGAVVGVAAQAAVARHGASRAALASVGAALAAAGLHAVLQGSTRYGWDVGRTGGLLVVAEACTLVAAFLAPLAVRARPGWRDLAAAAGVGVLVLAALIGNGATVKILLLWNFGLAGYFPSVVYAAAAGALTLALLAARHSAPGAFAGAVLLLAGGVGLHSTYQSGLVLAGLVLLAGTRRQERSLDAW